VADQRAIEAADVLSFEAYREQYVSPDRLGLQPAAPVLG
jgi:glutamate--cysteine ligase